MKALIAYIPVLHQGYIELLREYGKRVLLIDHRLVPHPDVQYLGRDMRALSPHEMAAVLEKLPYVSDVEVLEEATVEYQLGGVQPVLPREDVSLAFVEAYLQDRPVELVDLFLRWNWENIEKEKSVEGDLTISRDELDKAFMTQAVDEAKKSPDWWRQIGVVVAREGEVLCWAHNTHIPDEQINYALGDPRTPFNPGQRIDLSNALHGEASAVAWAAKEGESLEDADVYVTTFPCPTCARLLARAGVRKVFFREGYSLLLAQETFRQYGIELIQVEL